MITKESIFKYLWVFFTLYLLIGSLVVRFNAIDLIYILMFIFLIIKGYILDKKTLDEEK